MKEYYVMDTFKYQFKPDNLKSQEKESMIAKAVIVLKNIFQRGDLGTQIEKRSIGSFLIGKDNKNDLLIMKIWFERNSFYLTQTEVSILSKLLENI